MNNDFNKFLTDFGALIEQWMLAFDLFKNHGMDNSTALTHTEALFKAMISGVTKEKED